MNARKGLTAASAGVVALILLITSSFSGWYRSTRVASPPAEAGRNHDQAAAVAPGADIGTDVSTGPTLPPKQDETLVPYTGSIENVFSHPLIAYQERAFDNDSLSKGYNDWFITIKEFNRILEALHKKDYILIDIRSVFEERIENGKPVLAKKDLQLPRNKKPLILSVDDMNYYEYMRENGNVFQLVLDSKGNIATQSVNPSGDQVIAYDNDIVPILDAFVQAHPEFSFRGAKGILALTGYEGILGYRTNDTRSPNYESERNGALRVVQRLKETGWSFASHSWGHLDSAKMSYAALVRDTQRWKEEVEPLVGPTPTHVYPFGSSVSPGDPKFQSLLTAGFRVMLSVGPKPYLEVTSRYILMDRRRMDGLAFQLQRSMLLDLFDSKEIIDSIRPSRPGRLIPDPLSPILR